MICVCWCERMTCNKCLCRWHCQLIYHHVGFPYFGINFRIILNIQNGEYLRKPLKMRKAFKNVYPLNDLFVCLLFVCSQSTSVVQCSVLLLGIYYERGTFHFTLRLTSRWFYELGIHDFHSIDGIIYNINKIFCMVKRDSEQVNPSLLIILIG